MSRKLDAKAIPLIQRKEPPHVASTQNGQNTKAEQIARVETEEVGAKGE